MDPRLSLVLVMFAREFTDVPAHTIVDTLASVMAASPEAHAEDVLDEARELLSAHRGRRQASDRATWEWTAADDDAWRLPPDTAGR